MSDHLSHTQVVLLSFEPLVFFHLFGHAVVSFRFKLKSVQHFSETYHVFVPLSKFDNHPFGFRQWGRLLIFCLRHFVVLEHNIIILKLATYEGAPEPPSPRPAPSKLFLADTFTLYSEVCTYVCNWK